MEDAVYADDDEDNDRKRRRKRQADQQHHKDHQMHMHSGVATGHNMKHSKTCSLFTSREAAGSWASVGSCSDFCFFWLRYHNFALLVTHFGQLAIAKRYLGFFKNFEHSFIFRFFLHNLVLLIFIAIKMRLCKTFGFSIES